ncbi:hypothetical protein CPIN18021_1374 [Campylobacter pinnipediorum subsp. caledonicus]|uniref:Uncharacterized protein n=1 Tax=Campylobacter pinnipediorum subsp. caledonicus TaxID=1874362 RepID=A0A1S6U9N8_9BACT|nr:hypothetical protein [Campylobacter pinnipediorum]AQW86515.1 hypothetical protein CPIN18020_1325 [Campylobacter pinnipediorum subsp. caledonicus]AQW88167.1 hypothetical protein CPIN18021_1374 [Campylobacter pinnipediorum subsp. caledonicus]OPA71603.1 hypothetical protein BB381_03690 [Campylobacter pinnipediorum subsp. caledonicus]
MPLPFIVGIAAGALTVLAWNKRDELKQKACHEMQKGKDLLVENIQKSKDKISNVLSSKDEENLKTKKTTTRKRSTTGKSKTTKENKD